LQTSLSYPKSFLRNRYYLIEVLPLSFSLSAAQKDLKLRVQEFATKELAPKARDVDRKARFPRENVKEMADHGLLGLPLPLEYAGSGMDMTSYCIALEELAKACSTTATINLSHVLSAFSICLFGTPEQKEFYLKSMAKGENLGAFAITERTGGSDVASIQTDARVKDDKYVITGEKSYITSAGQADLYIVLASTDKSKGSKGLSAFIVDSDTEGLSIGKIEDLTGMRGISIGQIILKDCSIPRDRLIAKEGDGLKIALSCIDRGRVAISAIGVGLAQAALEASINYSKKRNQFGRSLSEFQAIQFMIADMATEVEAARLLTHYAGSLVAGGSRFTKEASMAKLYSSEVAVRAALNAIQIHGGYGLSREGPVERYMRDAKALAIMEGTSEMQRMIIAKNEIG
jgi:alkylation response protein AidB-like acyl-CoA dehydrogenase